VVECFRKFDLNVDGKLDQTEFGQVLKALDPDKWSDRAIDALFSAADKDSDGEIRFHQFFDWVYTDEAVAFRTTTALDE
jgi:Ca2+-binding EF-hand superfamily protein